MHANIQLDILFVYCHRVCGRFSRKLEKKLLLISEITVERISLEKLFQTY